MGFVQFVRIPVFAGLGVDGFLAFLLIHIEFCVKPVQVIPVHHRKAGAGKALLNGDRVAGVHVAAAGAALDRVAGALAVQGQLHAGPQGEDAVVLQQHHAFGGRLPGNGADSCLAGRYAQVFLSRILSHHDDSPFQLSEL